MATACACRWIKRGCASVWKRRACQCRSGGCTPTTAVDDWPVFPAIVKPANQHSSYGVSRRSLVENPAELRRQVQWVLEEFGGPAVVEEFVDGREIHVALIGNRDVTILPAMEIDYSLFGDIHDRIYTNEAKFDKQQPAVLPDEVPVPGAAECGHAAARGSGGAGGLSPGRLPRLWAGGLAAAPRRAAWCWM